MRKRTQKHIKIARRVFEEESPSTHNQLPRVITVELPTDIHQTCRAPMVYMPSINSQHSVFGDGDECYNLLSKVYAMVREMKKESLRFSLRLQLAFSTRVEMKELSKTNDRLKKTKIGGKRCTICTTFINMKISNGNKLSFYFTTLLAQI